MATLHFDLRGHVNPSHFEAWPGRKMLVVTSDCIVSKVYLGAGLEQWLYRCESIIVCTDFDFILCDFFFAVKPM